MMILDTFRISEKPNPLLPFHIQRTFEGLQLLKVDISFEELQRQYHELYQSYHGADQKCRLSINNEFQISIEPIEILPVELKVTLAKNHNQISGEGLQNYKTSQRQYWTENLNPKFDDIIGVNDLGNITETSRFNIFIKENDIFYTPPLNSGCVNGCLRRFLKSQGQIQEKNFIIQDLDKLDLYLGNSLRGLQKAHIVMN